jgi:hypothetical protein
MPIIAGLAIYTIEKCFEVPTKLAYYCRHEYEVNGFASLLSPEVREQVLNAGESSPVTVESPVEAVSIGLRNSRYPALTGLVVSNAIIENGGITLMARSNDGLVLVLLRFDLVNRRLLFDIEGGVVVRDNGSPESPEHAADVFGLLHGLVFNGELHVWNTSDGAILGRQNPNLPVNIDSAATAALLKDRIEALRSQAAERRGSIASHPGAAPSGGIDASA